MAAWVMAEPAVALTFSARLAVRARNRSTAATYTVVFLVAASLQGSLLLPE
jgi:hypothetical protein